MRIVVIDGQGGRIGSSLVEALRRRSCPGEILAIGANALATAAMLKAGADRGATGENPVIVVAPDADVILGPIGILAGNALLGEITTGMALAVSGSRARKILVPVNQCNITVAGSQSLTLTEAVEQAAELAVGLCTGDRG